jgi:LAS superfamily LD-carboxypeptidase LdcB
MKKRLKKKFMLILIFMTTISFVLANGSIVEEYENDTAAKELEIAEELEEPVTEDEAFERIEVVRETIDAEVIIYEDDIAVKELEIAEELEERVVEGEAFERVEVVREATEDEIIVYSISKDFPVIHSNSESLSYLVLVNRYFRLANDFTPSDLSFVNVQSLNGSHLLRATAARAAEDLFDTAYVEEGHVLLATSGYRSFITQESTHNYWISVLGLEEARRVSARPGHSEHQLGLALDLSTHALGGYLSEGFSSTPEGAWVRNNVHRFGFIVRYPQNREADTGFTYEPWHIRYVGVEVASEIFNSGQILEEFLED